MFCGNCGKELKDDAVFCGGCGIAIKKEEPIAEPEMTTEEIIKEIETEVEIEKFTQVIEEKFCPMCGRKLPMDALFCGGCGYSYEAKSFIDEPKTPEPIVVAKKKKGKGGIIAIVIILILAAIGGGGWYAYDNGYLDFIFKEEKSDDKKKDEDVQYCSDCDTEKIELGGELLCPECDVIIEKKDDDDKPKKEKKSVEEVAEAADSEYLFPSDRRLITEKDLEGMSAEEVALIRNEIYARHGYIFQSEVYSEYFGEKDWYIPDANFTPDRLNEIETANKDFLVQYETDMGWR